MSGEEDELSRLEKYGNATETSNHSRDASQSGTTTSWMSSDTHLVRSSSDNPPIHECKAEENRDEEHGIVGEESKGNLVLPEPFLSSVLAADLYTNRSTGMDPMIRTTPRIGLTSASGL